MKILTVLGARPQFIKAAIVSRELAKYPSMNELVVHTGQHFDANMSDVFFEQLSLPSAQYQLAIHGGGHGEMTGRMLWEIEKVLLNEKPDRVMVYGDTNSTLAGALAAAKLHIPVAHVEAGLRSFNMQMPEEINRILTDQISDILFCPTITASDNLKREGFEKKPVDILHVGDVMQDCALFFINKAAPPKSFNFVGEFILATIHRAENTDVSSRLVAIVEALNEIHKTIAPVMLPLHPRTKACVDRLGLSLNVNTLEPLGYLEMLWMLKHCSLVLTDSGGVQKEAFFFDKTCVTLRDQTEWVELVAVGANILVGADKAKIIATAIERYGCCLTDKVEFYGGGLAAKNIVTKFTTSG